MDQLPTSAQFSNWCFTLNNPTKEELEKFQTTGDGITYIIWQEEQGESGTRHLQGYVELETKRRLGYLRRRLSDRAHYEPRRGTAEEAIAYCRKPESRVEGGSSFTWGQPRFERRTGTQRGRHPEGCSGDKETEKTDGDGEVRGARRRAAQQALKDVRTLRRRVCTVCEETLLYPGFVHAVSFVQKNVLGPHRPNLRCITLKGPTGCGKSYGVYTRYSGELVTMSSTNGGTWFGGAEQGRVLLLDEFVGQCPINFLLQLLDPYPFRLPTKGGFTPAFYEIVFITTNLEPSQWYAATPGPNSSDQEIQKRQGNLDCLYRRLGWNYDPLLRSRDYVEVPELAIPDTKGQQTWLGYRLENLELPEFKENENEVSK